MLILLKNESPEDLYASLPEAVFVPVLNHTFLDLSSHREFIDSAEAQEAEALVVTSQRAVEALGQLDNVSKLFPKPVFTVGPATGAKLRQLGFVDVRGEDTGNGLTLSSEILPTVSYKKYLFFTGVIHRDVIPNTLNSMGATVIERTVYDTAPLPNCVEHFNSQYSQADKTPWIAFFSPSGVEGVVEYLKRKPRNTFRLAAIGPTTEAYLSDNGLSPDCVAEKPTPEHLLEAINFSKS
jgi:uroporphyrinogen-III synthase